MNQPIRIATVIQSQMLYSKVKKIFPPPHFDVTRNISHKEAAQEFVIEDEADIVIVDDMVKWKNVAMNTFQSYGIEVVLFNGDFDQLEEFIATKFPEVYKAEPSENTIIKLNEDGPKIHNQPIPRKLNQQPVQTEHISETVKITREDPKRQNQHDEEVERLQRELHELRKQLEIKDTDFQQREEKLLKEINQLQNQPKPEPEVIEVTGPAIYRAISQQFIIIGGLYSGVGSTFLALTLAKIFDNMNIETLLMEFPKNEPYLFARLGGKERLPRNYAFYYPQLLLSQKLPKNELREEWKEGNITWMPSDPSTGPLLEWNNDLMRKSVYRAKQTITILDIGTAWTDPALEDVLAQAHHVLLVCGPDQAKLYSLRAKDIVNKLSKEKLDYEFIANFVPDPVLPKTRQWFESLSKPPKIRFPHIPHNEMLQALWDCITIYDQNEAMLKKAYSHFLPLIKEIVPPNLITNYEKTSMSFIRRLFKK